MTSQTTIAASTAMTSLNDRIVIALFAGALFLSTFLLFVLEPMGPKRAMSEVLFAAHQRGEV